MPGGPQQRQKRLFVYPEAQSLCFHKLEDLREDMPPLSRTISFWSTVPHRSGEYEHGCTFVPGVFVMELRTEETSNNGQVLTMRRDD